MVVTIATKKFGIIGYPLSHTLSPAMHNRAMQAISFDGIYLPFAVNLAWKAMESAAALGFTGLSVTIPHKVAVMRHCVKIDPIAEKIGAVNTLLYDETLQGWVGHNSDAYGVRNAIRAHLEHSGREIRMAAILGSGGAARAAAFAIAEEFPEVKISIHSRNERTGKELASHLAEHCGGKIFWLKLGDSQNSFFHAQDLIVNTTPVGMTPNFQESPLRTSDLRAGQIVFDTVYNPRETMLLRYARAAGAEVILGLEMLLQQGTWQFEKFTGISAPEDVMRETLIEMLPEIKGEE